MLGKFYLGVLKIRTRNLVWQTTASTFHQLSSYASVMPHLWLKNPNPAQTPTLLDRICSVPIHKRKENSVVLKYWSRSIKGSYLVLVLYPAVFIPVVVLIEIWKSAKVRMQVSGSLLCLVSPPSKGKKK